METRFHWRFPLAICLTTLVVCCAVGCSSDDAGDGSDEPATGVLTVYVVNYPLQYFSERIGGDHVRVVFPGPADEDPAFWKPDSDTITEYQKADLILLNGATYAKWTRGASLPDSKTVNTSASASGSYIEVADAIKHSHGPDGDHSHAGTAFTTWLDAKIALAQADAIREAFAKLRPQHADAFQKNYTALEADLVELDLNLGEIVKGKTERPIFFSHPVYQYLQRRHGLNAQSVPWEADEVPTEKQWKEFKTMLEEHPAKWMVWEGEPIEQNVKRLDELGLRGVVFSPCGAPPDEGDYLQVMQKNVENLRQAFAD